MPSSVRLVESAATAHRLHGASAFMLGVRREDLILETDQETVAAGRRAYDEWRLDRDHTRERGQQPSITFQTVGDRAKHSQAGTDQLAGDVTITDAKLV